MKTTSKRMTSEQLIQLFGNLFDPDLLPPDTPEEVDAELREAGLDPGQVGRNIAELVKELGAKLRLDE